MKIVYVSGTGRGNGLEAKSKINNTAFPGQEVFQLTSEQNLLKGNTFYKGNAQRKFIFWIHFCILIVSNYFTI
jgi:hypothetical protein